MAHNSKRRDRDKRDWMYIWTLRHVIIIINNNLLECQVHDFQNGKYLH